MADKVSIYPLGIVGHHYEDHVDYQPDPEIDRLWTLYEGRLSNLNHKAFFFQVMDYCRKQFHCGLTEYMRRNVAHAHISYSMKLFLADTLHYINTGKRMMHISTWDYLLRQQEQFKDAPHAYVHDTPKPIVLEEVGNDGLAKWMAHPDGFVDMVWTLRILFGTVSC